MGAMAGRCAVAIMAKAPQAGRSKTRLCPPLESHEAAVCSAAFLRDMTDAVAIAARTAPIDSYVAYAPAGSEVLLAPHVAPGTRLMLADGAGVTAPGVTGFGRVLLGTMQTLFEAGYASVCVLNSDSPTLPPATLASAALALAGDADIAVLGAATDGGYYLLGLRRPDAAMFADIEWSTQQVAAQTRAQAARSGLAVVGLPDWYDVDDEAGLRRLLSEIERPELADRCFATRAAVARLDLHRRLGVAA